MWYYGKEEDMVKSKAWNWELADEDIWNIPSEDVYYYVHRWKEAKYKDLLDLGCGLGRNGILFAKNGFEVHAFDLSKDAINSVNEKNIELNLNIKTSLGDMLDLPYDDESFDCLLSYHVISHTDSAGIIKVIDEIDRVLRRNGEFYLTLCSKDSFSFKSGKYEKIDENSVIKLEGPEAGIPHFFVDLDDIKRLFAKFELIKIRHTYDIFSDYTGSHYFLLGKKK
jgi:SAM-dependent methyltransferase